MMFCRVCYCADIGQPWTAAVFDIRHILCGQLTLGVDRYVFFRADADTDYYRSSRPITDILNRYTCLVKK